MFDKYHKRFWPFVVALAFIWVMVSVGDSLAKGGEIQGRRVALIVGNSKYKSVYSLKNAVSDSTSVSAVLSRLGFEVIEVSDATKAQFVVALDKFSAAAKDAEAAVFYYSGHGFQLGGTNFLVPTDAKLNNRDTILKETLRLNDVIKAVQDRNRQTLIFLDACRNNPLPESVRDKTMIDGLAQLDAGTGTFVAFATQPGNITRDGAGDHSPFAAALIEHMETPGISISDMMIRVRNSVEVATLQTQTPWDQSSLRTQFYFSPEEELSADLTDEDKALLLSLPPALRKKFAAQFGIKFGDDGVIVTKTVQIKRRFSISAGGDDAPDVPVAKNKPVIKGRFKIASGTSNNEDVVVASLEPKNNKPAAPVLAPIDDELARNGSTFIPLPNFRPGVEPAKKEADQLVASLSPNETKPEVKQRTDPKPELEIVAKPATPAAKTLPSVESKPETLAKPEVAAKPEKAQVVKKAVTAPIAEKAKAVAVAKKAETAPFAPKITKTPDVPKVFVPEQLKPKSTTAAPLVAEKSSAPAISTKPKATKPRVIAITNPGLAKNPNTPTATVEKDVQVAINSSTRSTTSLKPSFSRSSLKPVVSSAKRLIGKEIIQQPPVEQQSKPVKDIQVAVLEPVTKTTDVRSVEVTPKDKNEKATPLGVQKDLEVAKVAPVGLEDKPKKDVKIASLDSTSATNNSQSDENIAPAVQPTISPPSHALEVQAELARLGCYRSKVDGLWGAYSARALLRYYGNKKIAPSILEPTNEMLTMLRSDEVVVCKRTITKKPKRKVITKKSNKKTKSARKKKGKRIRIRKSKTVRKKALKKSLSKGVFR